MIVTNSIPAVAIRTTLYSDPACPWAYSATPALTTLRWRYRDQLDWRLVTIGLREETADQERGGYTAGRQAAGSRRFRDRYGMPFTASPRARLVATGRACRAIVAARLAPALEGYLVASHRSPEPGHALVLEALRLDPLLDLGLRLGEGSGAALALPLLTAARAILVEMATFAEAGVSDTGR